MKTEDLKISIKKKEENEDHVVCREPPSSTNAGSQNNWSQILTTSHFSITFLSLLHLNFFIGMCPQLQIICTQMLMETIIQYAWLAVVMSHGENTDISQLSISFSRQGITLI